MFGHAGGGVRHEGPFLSWTTEIWSTTPIDLDGRLPLPDRWERIGPQEAEYAHDDGWLVTVEPLAEEDRGDRPSPAVRGAIPGALCCLLVDLEPIDAPQAAYRLFNETVAALMRDREAVCSDGDEALTLDEHVQRELGGQQAS